MEEQETMKIIEARVRAMQNGSKEYQQVPAIDESNNAKTPSDSAASRSLLDLHIAIGAQHIRFLPQFSDIEYDECTNPDEHLPIIVRISTYNRKMVVKQGKKADKFNKKLETWAHNFIAKQLDSSEAQAVTVLDILAYDEDDKHVPDVPGLEENDTWEVKSRHIKLLPPFKEVRSAAELRCLVRYCLYLAAANGLKNFDGSGIPRDIGFPRVLIDYCKRM
jgi:hypothetical protein